MLYAAANLGEPCTGEACLPSSMAGCVGGPMGLTTVEQVRRIFRTVAGFTLLLVGVVMIITPGPGWLVIFLGLGLLAAEFVWARRLMDRIKHEGGRIKETVLGLTDIPKRDQGAAGRTDQRPADERAD